LNIAIIGYGKMGKVIEEISINRGHNVISIIDNKDWNIDKLNNVDVAIEFTSPENAVDNIIKCFESSVPVVVGTTGWYNEYDKVINKCKENDASILSATNFSIGVNIFFEINRKLAKLINKQNDYNAEVSETHHIHKLDSPSGTAITIANDIINNINRYNKWSENDVIDDNTLPIIAKRDAEVPGTHQVKYSSNIDEITIKHKAKNREGFALGAVIAAEFIQGKKGVFTMQDVI
jgi:4-hydroxy-tetrahydrodipicolinate reductase